MPRVSAGFCVYRKRDNLRAYPAAFPFCEVTTLRARLRPWYSSTSQATALRAISKKKKNEVRAFEDWCCNKFVMIYSSCDNWRVKMQNLLKRKGVEPTVLDRQIIAVAENLRPHVSKTHFSSSPHPLQRFKIVCFLIARRRSLGSSDAAARKPLLEWQ
jgi:hypothetical protein